MQGWLACNKYPSPLCTRIYFLFLFSGESWLWQHLTEHAARVCGPWAGLSPELRQDLHALRWPLPSHVPHPVHPPSAKQRLPPKHSGPLVLGANSYYTNSTPPTHSSSGQQLLLCPGCGFVHRRGHGVGLPSGLHHTGDSKTAACAKTQKLGDVSAFTARRLAPVAEETERMADIKEEEVLLPKVLPYPEASPSLHQ